MKVGLIEEILHTIWLANVVIMKKVNGSWRMCVDFTDVNKAYPKESYPQPNINNLVDATTKYTILSFCDDFSGYNQILMWEEDHLKMAFIIDK